MRFFCILKKIFFLYFFTFFVNIYAQNYDLKPQIFYDQNKQKIAEGYTLNGKPEGYWINYNSEGKKISEGNRKNHLLDGIWKFYDNMGEISEMITYNEGKKNGYYMLKNVIKKYKIESFYENNVLEGEERKYILEKNKDILVKKMFYKQGKLEGICFEYDSKRPRITNVLYYEQGKLIRIENINQYNEQGMMAGIWQEYKDRTLEKECEYKQGVLDGFCKEYDLNGKLFRFNTYVNGKFIQDERKIILSEKEEKRKEKFEKEEIVIKDGVKKVIQFDEITHKVNKIELYYVGENNLFGEGKLDKLGNYTGNWKFYYPNKQIKSIGNYKNGLKIGEWSYFYLSGSLEEKGNYNKIGELDGNWENYYENGKLAKQEEYENGKLTGKAIEYNKNEKILAKGNYIDGEKHGNWEEFVLEYSCKGKYDSGKKIGNWACYYPSQKKYFEGSYQDGLSSGKHVFFYPSEKVMKIENWFRGKLNGNYSEFNDSEELVYEIKYKMNQPLISIL
jgi:antitoxin component YwqK of YwqJK toxin-antitoxin module